MKVILSMSVSLNGFIATKEGSESFLADISWMRFVKLAHGIGCFVWGKKTYDILKSWGGDYLKELDGVKIVVVSHSPDEKDKRVIWASSPEEAISKLEQEGFKEMIITGGSTINSEFAKKGLIDEIRLKINPAVLGEGIPVFAPVDFVLKLKYKGAEEIGEEVVEIVYEVVS
jgi:dihydrofolate reductase